MGAIEAWKQRVEVHHAQSEAVMAAAELVGRRLLATIRAGSSVRTRGRKDDPVLDVLLSNGG